MRVSGDMLVQLCVVIVGLILEWAVPRPHWMGKVSARVLAAPP